MEAALIASNSPDAIRYQESDGKTDAYAGVSVDISAFVKLAKNAVEQARGNASPAPTGMFKDGHYKAEQADYHQGYKYYVEITIKNGKISAVDWDAYKENSPLTKKKESEDGTYVMTETGKKWHEQAKIMPVSYTHLDVYKRQLVGGLVDSRTAEGAVHGGEGVAGHGHPQRNARAAIVEHFPSQNTAQGNPHL